MALGRGLALRYPGALTLTLTLTLSLTLSHPNPNPNPDPNRRQERERHAAASSTPGGVNQRTPFALLTGDVSLLVVEPGANQRTPRLLDTASALHLWLDEGVNQRTSRHRWLDETVLDEAVRDHRNALAAGPKTSRPPTPPSPVFGRVTVRVRIRVWVNPDPDPDSHPHPHPHPHPHLETRCQVDARGRRHGRRLTPLGIWTVSAGRLARTSGKVHARRHGRRAAPSPLRRRRGPPSTRASRPPGPAPPLEP